MILRFHEADHRYESDTNQQWIGCTTLVGCLKEPFHRQSQAERSHKNRNSKWYMIPVDEILQAWDNEAKRATDLGHWYHDKREKDLWSKGIIDGLKVIMPVIEEGVKIAPNQVLTDGIYPEHMIYIESVGLCGQSDVVRVHDGTVYISDYKTSKEITTAGYTNWEGITKKMLPPVAHLQDCNLNHYALQLSIYMYGILRYNPSLKPGRMHIEHVKFVKAGEDKWGYPIAHLHEGEPIMESITILEVPYLKTEVKAIIDWLKLPGNKDLIKKHS